MVVFQNKGHELQQVCSPDPGLGGVGPPQLRRPGPMLLQGSDDGELKLQQDGDGP
jgi:hypothetical protein